MLETKVAMSMNLPEQAYFKRNYTLGIINGTLVNFGMAFIDPFTVLPVFILRLGASNFIVGLVSALSGAGWFLPQMFVARVAESRKFLLNIYRKTTVLRILAWGGVALCVSFVDPERRFLYLLAFISFFLTAQLGAGLAAVPFLEITSKTIPTQMRGTFFGTRRFLGGLLGILAGLLVGVILNTARGPMPAVQWAYDFVQDFAERAGAVGHAFPYNYGILFLIGGSLISIGLLSFCFVGEPPAPRVGEPEEVIQHVKSGFHILKKDANYRLFYFARIAWQFTAMAFPFYSSYAYQHLHFSENAVGIFVSLWVGSGVLSNYVWGRLLDSRGNKLVLVITAFMGILPPVIILVIEHFFQQTGGGESSLLFPMVASTFFINGFIRSGRVISNLTYLLEFAPLEKRPLYVGFMNSFTFPFMLSPAVGGFILQLSSINVLFGAAAVFSVINILLCLKLKEPRTDIP